jgi:hypothetical protein
MTPVIGETLRMVGGGFWTSKAFANVAVPPPGPEFENVRSRKPRAASPATRKLPVTCVVVTDVAETSFRPATGSKVVTPGIRPDPWIVKSTTLPLPPASGTTLVIVGAGFVTEKPPERVTKPEGPELETETFLTPAATAEEIAM